MNCRIENCPRGVNKYKSSKLCTAHYARYRRHGSAEYVTPKPPAPSYEFLLTAKDHPKDECLVWKFHVNNSGYGTLRLNNSTVYAHRVSLELHSGVSPENGQQACHSCNNRLCINPAHLRWGTRVENMADARKAGTLAIGERVGGAKITADIAKKIIGDKRTLKEIGDEYGLAVSTVSGIRNRRTWAWL